MNEWTVWLTVWLTDWLTGWIKYNNKLTECSIDQATKWRSRLHWLITESLTIFISFFTKLRVWWLVTMPCFSHEKRQEATEGGESGLVASDETTLHHSRGQGVGVTGLYPKLRTAGAGEWREYQTGQTSSGQMRNSFAGWEMCLLVRRLFRLAEYHFS